MASVSPMERYHSMARTTSTTRTRLPASLPAVRRRTHGARLAAAIAAARRRWGDHIIRVGAEIAAPSARMGLPALSTGSLGLDLITGGLPRGAITEIAGVDGVGAETLAHTALARCQRDRGLALLLDAGNLADPEALDAVGIDHRALILVCPTTAPEAWGALGALASCGALDLLVASLTGLMSIPGAAYTGVARRGLALLDLALRGHRTAALLLSTPLTVSSSPWSLSAHQPALLDGWATTGGPALARAAALRVALLPTGPRLGPHGDVVALGARARVVKLHGLSRGPALPLEVTARGTHHALELVTLGQLTGCVTGTVGMGTGITLTMDEIALGRTPLRAAAFVAGTPAVAAALEGCIRAAWPTLTRTEATTVGLPPQRTPAGGVA